jgi:hypothetical protein
MWLLLARAPEEEGGILKVGNFIARVKRWSGFFWVEFFIRRGVRVKKRLTPNKGERSVVGA